MNLSKIAEEMKEKVSNDDGTNVFEFPVLTGSQFYRLTQNYLRGYNFLVSEMNPNHPFSSYIVAVFGGQKNA